MTVLRWRHVILVMVLIVAAVILVKSRPDVHSAAAATPTPTAAAAVTPPDPALYALSVRFVEVWRAGGHDGSGGPAWLTQLATVATPELVRGLAFTDPDDIPTAAVTSVTTPAAGAAVVAFADGTRVRLVVTGGLVSAVEQG